MTNRFTPAMFQAAVRGLDVDASPDGILAAEAQGQRDLVETEILPKDTQAHQDAYEKLGIAVLGDFDDIFYKVQLPAGWNKQATGHSMWSKLLDDKGRERASIFYKAAFYDRHAHIGFNTRYRATYEPACGWDADYETRKAAGDIGIITDCGVVIWRSEIIPDADDSYGKAGKVATVKLDEMYPHWRDIYAYWDEA